eukprot:4270058-Pleurochrysis_carterae.AAC.3
MGNGFKGGGVVERRCRVSELRRWRHDVLRRMKRMEVEGGGEREELRGRTAGRGAGVHRQSPATLQFGSASCQCHQSCKTSSRPAVSHELHCDPGARAPVALQLRTPSLRRCRR